MIKVTEIRYKFGCFPEYFIMQSERSIKSAKISIKVKRIFITFLVISLYIQTSCAKILSDAQIRYLDT
jgi:hypothetical protein